MSHPEEEFWTKFLDDEAGTWTRNDPRMTVEGLRIRGVELEDFLLV